MRELKVNEGLWNSVSTGDRSRIAAILKKSRLLDTEGSLVPSKDVGSPEGSAPASPEAGFCKIACDAAEAAAVEACNGLDGVAQAVCVAAAKAAGDECRKNC